MFADRMTKSMQATIDKTENRRAVQSDYKKTWNHTNALQKSKELILIHKSCR